MAKNRKKDIKMRSYEAPVEAAAVISPDIKGGCAMEAAEEITPDKGGCGCG